MLVRDFSPRPPSRPVFSPRGLASPCRGPWLQSVTLDPISGTSRAHSSVTTRAGQALHHFIARGGEPTQSAEAPTSSAFLGREICRMQI